MADLATDNANAARELGIGVAANPTTTDKFFTDAYTAPVAKTPSQAYRDNEHAMYAASQIFSDSNAVGRDWTDGYDNRGFITTVSNALFNSGKTDGTLTRDSIQEMLRESDNLLAWTGLYNDTYNPKFIKSLKYLDDNWDSPQVQSLLTPDGDLDANYAMRGTQRLETHNKAIVDKYAGGDPYVFNPADQLLGQVTLTGKFNEELTKAGTVNRGEGTWKSAARILKLDGEATSEKDIKALSDALAAEYSDEQARTGSNTSLKSLQPNHELITAENNYLILKRINDEALRTRLRKLFEST